MHDTETRLKDLVRFHCKGAKWPSPIAGLTLFRSDAPTTPVRSLYDPRICIVLQGRKRIRIEERVIDIAPGDYLAVVLDLPVSANVVEASPVAPHLSLTIDLDPVAIRALIEDETTKTTEATFRGAATTAVTADLLDPVERLVRLLERPRDIPALAPLIQREIVYRLLQGKLGPMLRQCAENGSRLARIAKVTSWITQHFDKPFEITELATMAAMSVTTFHRNFKAATDMSPVQFRTRLCLHEARRRLHLGEAHLGRIAFDIGYRSQSQFNREYHRMFGSAPGQDMI
jgi:AraC-like DNA-binding protein